MKVVRSNTSQSHRLGVPLYKRSHFIHLQLISPVCGLVEGPGSYTNQALLRFLQSNKKARRDGVQPSPISPLARRTAFSKSRRLGVV